MEIINLRLIHDLEVDTFLQYVVFLANLVLQLFDIRNYLPNEQMHKKEFLISYSRQYPVICMIFN